MDKLTRSMTVEELFSNESIWFTPHKEFKQEGAPKFEITNYEKFPKNNKDYDVLDEIKDVEEDLAAFEEIKNKVVNEMDKILRKQKY